MAASSMGEVLRVKPADPVRLVATFWVLVGTACGAPSADAPADGVTEADSAGITIVENDLAILDHSCRVAQEPRVTIGEAIADPPYQLHRVFGATVLGDGRIALVNQGSEELRFYDAEGTFLRAAGREGQGPGEFSNAFYLWRLPGDTLWVGDYNPWEYEVFAPSGEWLRQVRPHPTQANSPDGGGVLSDGRLLLGFHDWTNRTPDFTVTDSLHVLLYAPDGSLDDTLHVTPDGRWGQGSEDRMSTWLYRWFESTTEITARDRRYVMGHGSTPELRVFLADSTPRLERIIRWTGVDQTITDADRAAARAEIAQRYPEDGASWIRELLLSDRRPVAETMPVMAEVQLGVGGAFWVRDYPRPGIEDPHRWLRFDPAGRFTCRLILPDDLDVYELGPDYVLGLQEGEFGVEQVALYDVTLPSESD